MHNKKAILIINSGTPDSPSEEDVKKYLNLFLSDKRVIHMADIMWQPILQGVVLKKLTPMFAEKHKKIWMPEGAPLKVYTEAQRDNLAKLLPDYIVEYAMSYSKPMVKEAILSLLDRGVQHLTILPLYPQYSGTTTGSIFDDVSSVFTKKDNIIDLRFISRFYKHEGYIDYFANKIKLALEEKQKSDEVVQGILFSYQNIPQEYVDNGDSYASECIHTTELIMEKIKDTFKLESFTAYRHVSGHQRWMTPKTNETIKNLPKEGIKNLIVVAPGFVSDGVDTIPEMEGENKECFLEAGGESFTYIHAMNKDMELAHILVDVIKG